LPSHNIGFAKARAKFPGVEDFRTLSRKKPYKNHFVFLFFVSLKNENGFCSGSCL